MRNKRGISLVTFTIIIFIIALIVTTGIIILINKNVQKDNTDNIIISYTDNGINIQASSTDEDSLLNEISGNYTKEGNEWRTVNISQDGFNDKFKELSYGDEEVVFYLDLDSNNVEEKITLYSTGKDILIDDNNYTVNKYFKENDIESCNDNYYDIVDLNDDGYLEIIHRTCWYGISPITNRYTIYNYRNTELIEVGEISIIGNIPDEVKVRKNEVRFEYWPYEAYEDIRETVTITLNV